MAEKKQVIFDIDGVDYTSADGWDSMTRDEFIKVATVMANRGLSEPERGMLAMLILMDVQMRWFGEDARLKTLRSLNAYALRDIIYGEEGLKWLWEENTMTAYLVQNFWYKGVKYIGAPDAMLKVTAAEMSACMTYWDLYCTTMDMPHLDMIVAILYRPVNLLWWANIWKWGANGDKRMPLNSYWLKRRADKMRGLDAGLKMAIMIQFIGALNQFHGQHPYVFKKKGRNTDNTKQPKPAATQTDTLRWHKLEMLVAEKGVLGALPDVERTDKDRFFVYLNKIMKENAEAAQRMKKLK